MDKVKDLAAYLDSRMDISANTSVAIRSCYFHLHHISQINKFLPSKTRERAVIAQVTSRLDYSNSLLYLGTIVKNFVRLQRLQKAAVRIIVGCPSMPASLLCSETCIGYLRGRVLASRSWYWSIELSTTVGQCIFVNLSRFTCLPDLSTQLETDYLLDQEQSARSGM